MDVKEMKREAARRALEYVEDDMILGLGTGSTASEFVELLGQKVRDGLRVTCVPTSEATLKQALSLGIPMATIDEQPEIDLTVDGADELDRHLRLIKGGGGALLREKIVASGSAQVVIIADQSKLVDTLGAFPLPIEVVQFGLGVTRAMIEDIADELGLEGPIKQRLGGDGRPFVTDGGNFILDCAFGRIDDPEALAELLPFTPGVVDHGLFIGLADQAIVAGDNGVQVFDADVEQLSV
ncbi:MAG: ribose-5-phosphate isomerase RpiA [Alphaproteobacteria bacterium]|nr:ribose-5-phosphate isomerase RpiA [Alphaproteobacteria bacterium]